MVCIRLNNFMFLRDEKTNITEFLHFQISLDFIDWPKKEDISAVNCWSDNFVSAYTTNYYYLCTINFCILQHIFFSVEHS